ncbi:heavy-metal-associated domain-containing protein [Metabacillus sp. RGM 3146]|uniref:heavy-metal-associated domain-containing protein n=1 Tax=Metabacillus sp. RGM 3146 TaxID=3401092 RepID=UPI003B9C0506
MKSGVIKVEGLQTQNDADKVAQALHAVWGIRRAEVSLNSSEATFTYDENAANDIDFHQAITEAGFKIK